MNPLSPKSAEQSATAGWMRVFAYRHLAAEISATTRFCDELIQVSPLPHEDGLLLKLIDAPVKRCLATPEQLAVQKGAAHDDRRVAILLNGNFNSTDDIQGFLDQLRSRIGRCDRVFAVLYSPYMRWLFRLITFFGLRRGVIPETFITETELRSLLRLSGFELARVRYSLYLPVYIPIISWLFNTVMPVIPILSRLALTWIIVLRPVRASDPPPSLSIVIPARNEKGNLEAALKRMPSFASPDIEVVFVEGNSTDGTWEEIQRLVAAFGSQMTLRAYQQTGRGKNDAVRLGFSRATGDLLTILDADLTMPPELLPRFYDAWRLGHGDFINGNRLVYPMEGEAMRPLNLLGNRFFAKALSFVLGVSVGDSLCGTKLIARRDYERLTAWRQRFGDFDPFGDFELLFAASELALGIVDLPMRYRARTYGTTNISRFRDGWLLLRMTVYGFFRLRPGRRR
ncbi:MAG: glycosyltransferase family 2 protein [Planctomycetota bacterium]